MSDFHGVVTLVAAKEHACCECHSVITKASQYDRDFGAMDGRGFSYKTCLPCASAREWLDKKLRQMNCLNADEGIKFGDLHSELVEFASEERFLGVESLRLLLDIAQRRNDAGKFQGEGS
ncbi:hypothetical protein [Pseudomonas sp. EggHat1]|uniref:hypothetical protein n=1 Tax=Pseudomonas sp. EggHat1 TaxID=2761624 RepID=UPI0018675777|nr:hypothetical protein [Pseudomonas sp. EggHat1]